MDEDDYRRALLSMLRDHSAAAEGKLREIDQRMPDKARRINIVVHLPQDVDGAFSVMVHLDGPDLHALNVPIRDVSELFGVRNGPKGFSPPVPMFDPFDLPFDVNDAIVGTAIAWLQEVWMAFGGTRARLPATAQGEDGFAVWPKVPLRP